jgi:branched-chain amino acid transport system permease protein
MSVADRPGPAAQPDAAVAGAPPAHPSRSRAWRAGLPAGVRAVLPAVAVLAGAAVLSLLLPDFYVGLLTLSGLYGLVALGLHLFMGRAGQVSMGQAAFFGLGAYTSALLGLRAGVSPWLGSVAGAAAAAVAADFLGRLTLHLREHYLALATLALGIAVDVTFAELRLTGGSSGLTDIPPFRVGGAPLGAAGYAVLAWGALALAMAVAGNLASGPYGRALRALAASEVGAASVGLHAAALKRQTFAVSAAFAGLAGAIYSSWVSYIDPTTFGFVLSVNFVLMAVVGGLRSLWGGVVGAVVVVALDQFLKVTVPLLVPSARGDFQLLFYGIILGVFLIYRPDGLAGLAASLWRLRRRGGGTP